ncbi:hypothetical protein [Humisphaera borealis]|uniref:Uncharacterized protein n=1 Tax=Humisphaera borealis TaxID=2807512 RepID=A0A7M2WUN4_9BACT|nr:hypothetical protein [Humisphaera borealis]QOV88994.1 hypothetical protein IPV69_22645 [Humisphaera borealis]
MFPSCGRVVAAMAAVATNISSTVGQPMGDISLLASQPGRRPMFIVRGTAGSYASPHSGQFRLSMPRSG